MKTYRIWKQYHTSREWSKTSHTVLARTQKEADSKMRRKFASFCLTSMSLMAKEENGTET